MKKFRDAFSGLKTVLSHKAVLVQMILGVMAVIGGVIIHLDYYEWLAFIVCIAMVIAAEVMNTAVERIGDYLSEEHDDKIREIKDIAAAAVLLASLGALAVCIAALIRRFL